MKYTVLWTPRAERALADVWIAADDRKEVTAAASKIDVLLAKKPASVGDLRFDTVRTLLVPPLGVDYEVIEGDRIVYVLFAWDTTKPDGDGS
jgi:hypothetical protein